MPIGPGKRIAVPVSYAGRPPGLFSSAATRYTGPTSLNALADCAAMATASPDPLTVITDRLKLLATRKAEMWWDIGCLLDAMATRGVVGSAGIRDWAAHAEKTVGIERSEARRFRRIANLFSRDFAMRFGADKLELLVKLVETSHEMPPVLDPMRLEVLSQREDGSTRVVTFAECTVDDLRFTIKRTAGRKTSGDSRFGQLGEARDALDAALRRSLGRRAPKVKLECAHAPGQCLSLVGLEPTQIEAVGRALVAHAKAAGRRRSAAKR